jgi:hypothetical protein
LHVSRTSEQRIGHVARAEVRRISSLLALALRRFRRARLLGV